MSVEQEITAAVHAAIHNTTLHREPGESVFDLYTRAAMTAIDSFVVEHERLRGEVTEFDTANRQLAMQLVATTAELAVVTGERDDALLVVRELTGPAAGEVG
jgi:hypothetical protein